MEIDKIHFRKVFLLQVEALTLANCFQKNQICDKLVRIGWKTKGEGIWHQRGKTTTQILARVLYVIYVG